MDLEEKVAENRLPEEDYFLPDLCRGEGLFTVVILSELLAVLVTTASGGLFPLDWAMLARASMISLWIALVSAMVLCLSRNILARFSQVQAAVISFVLILLVALVCGAAAEVVRRMLFPLDQPTPFRVLDLMTYLVLAAIPAGILLRYLFLQQQLRIRQKAELEARIQALQSRIRPHFLFNSMNMIASLIAIDPKKAEQVVEDISDLFRSALTDSQILVPLRDELSLCRRYLALEKLRLGDRLITRWDIGDYGDGVKLPSLTLQPLLENAIYHGVQLVPEGGEVTVAVQREGKMVEVVVTNPLNRVRQQKKGNKIALNNIRQRLLAHFGDDAQVITESAENCYITRVIFPASW